MNTPCGPAQQTLLLRLHPSLPLGHLMTVRRSSAGRGEDRSQRCRGVRRGAAHSHRWVQKPIFTQTVPLSSLPKQSRPHRPEMKHKERKASSTKACINLLIGNWLKIKALRLTVSVRLRILAALSAISEAHDFTDAPGAGSVLCGRTAPAVTPRSNDSRTRTHNPALLSARQPQVKRVTLHPHELPC